MIIAVTGGSGFVGNRIIKSLLQNGHQVRNVDIVAPLDNDSDFIFGNICDLNDCITALNGCEAVIHAAALYRDDVRPIEMYGRVNVDGTRNLIQACERLSIEHFQFISSFSVYGLDGAGMTEDGEKHPVNEYGKSKLLAEKLCTDWQNRKAQLRTLQIVRPCVIFGENNRGNVYTLMSQIARRRFALLGTGSNIKSMAYVGNVAAFLTLLIRQKTQDVRVYNYADKPDLSVSEIVDTISSALDARILRLPVSKRIAMLAACFGDALGVVTGKAFILNSERVKKFFADTSLPTDQLDKSGFVRPYEMQKMLTETVRAEFPKHK